MRRHRMRVPSRFLLPLITALLILPVRAAPAEAQAADAVRDELLMQFETSMDKFIALAEAMPADRYRWAPGEGVMEVGRVFMHVARYNYLYPSGNMGASLPAGVDMGGMEAVRDKDQVLRSLEASRAYVRETVGGRSAAELTRETRLYGRAVEEWSVLVQLVAHMNEHLGQSIAYARMNGVVPPWSR